MHTFCLHSRSLNFPLTEFENARGAFVAGARELALIADGGQSGLEKFGVYYDGKATYVDRYQVPFSLRAAVRQRQLNRYFSQMPGKTLFAVDRGEGGASADFFTYLLDNNQDFQRSVHLATEASLSKERLKDLDPRSASLLFLGAGVNSIGMWHPLENYYPHLFYLQQMTIRADFHSYGLEYTLASKEDVWITSYEEYLFNHYGSTHILSRDKNYSTLSRPLHRPTNGYVHKFIYETAAGIRVSADEKREEGVALKGASHQSDPVLRELWRLKATGELTSYELLRLFSNNLPLLAEPAYQTLFHLWLFRETHASDGTVQLHEELATPSGRTLLKGQFDQFMATAVRRFWDQQPEGRPDFLPCLFLFETEILFYNYLSGERPPHVESRLPRLLARLGLTQEEQGACHLVEVFADSQREESLSSEEMTQVLVNWAIYCHHPKKKGLTHPVALYESQRFIHRLIGRMGRQSDLMERAAQLIFDKLGIKFVKGSMTRKGTSILVKGEEIGFSFNFLTGELFSSQGRLSLGSPITLEGTVAYKRIFGDRKISTPRLEEGSLYFQDTWYGQIRICEQAKGWDCVADIRTSTSDWLLNHALERHYNEKWLRYIPHDKLQFGKIPDALLFDYTHWAPVDGCGQLYFCSRQDGQMRYLMGQEGSITPLAEDAPQLEQVLHRCPQKDRGLAHFDSPEFILQRHSQTGITSIHFVRYLSLQGTPLAFEASEGRLYWAEDRQYALSSQARHQYLGHIPNTLFLTHQQSGEGRLLVPLRPITDFKQTVGPSGHLLSKGMAGEGELEEGRYRFVSLRVDKEESLHPTNMEGTLLLSYLALTQGDYGVALAHIKEVTRGTPLSQDSLQILGYIVQFSGRATGEAATIRLLAGLATYRKTNQVNLPSLEDAIDNYLDQRLRLQRRFLLGREDEESIMAFARSFSKQEGLVLKINTRLAELCDLSKGSVNYDSTLLKKTLTVTLPTRWWPSEILELEEAVDKRDFKEAYQQARTGGQDAADLFHYLAVASVTKKPELPFTELETNLLLAASHPDNRVTLPELSAGALKEWCQKVGAPSPLDITLTGTKRVSKSPPSTQISLPKLALTLTLTQDGEGRSSLEKLYNTYFIHKPRTHPHRKCPYEQALSKHQEGALAMEFERCHRDLEVGRNLNDQLNAPEPREEQSIMLFQQSLKDETVKTQQRLDKLLVDLLQQARQNKGHEARLELPQPDRRLSLADLKRLFVQRKASLYPSNLLPNEIAQLYEETGLYLDLENYLNQLKRASQELAMLKEGNPTVSKEKLLYKLWEETRPRQYNLQDLPSCVVVENIANISLRKGQTEMLGKMLTRDARDLPKSFVGQMLMGEGKTSVVASVWLAEMVNTGRLPCLVLTSALFSPVRGSLGEAQWKRFGQIVDDIEDVATWRSDQTKEYTAESLQQAYDKLIWLKENRGALIINQVTLRSLETTFLKTARTFASSAEFTESAHKRIQLFAKILLFFKTEGVALADEVDQVLNMNFEVNSPTGTLLRLPAYELELLRHIYELASESSLENKIGFGENRQSEMTEKVLTKEVIPSLAHRLSTYEPLLLNEQDKPSFVRYITGQIDQEVEKLIKGCNQNEHALLDGDCDYSMWLDRLTQIATKYASPLVADLPFLRQLEIDHQSEDPGLVKQANLIGLTRGWLTTIFPQIGQWKTGRRFGRKANGSVGPFAATGIETARDFSSPHVAASCHMQAALHLGINRNQIAHLGRLFATAANHYLEKNGENYEDTIEAKEFAKLFGTPLHTIHQKEKQRLAHDHIKKTREKTLDVSSRLAEEHVGQHEAYFTSTALHTPHMFVAWQGMSGTLEDVDELAFELGDNACHSVGIAGRIVDRALETDAYQVSSGDPKQMLDELLTAVPDPQNWSGIADAGGLCANQASATAEVARAFSEVLKAKGIDRQAVLFFQPKVGDLSPEPLRYLHAWELGGQKPRLIGLATKEAIEGAGYDYKRCFYFWDEYHVTGIDLPPIPLSKGFVTVDQGTPFPLLLQAYLRYRDYFFGQQVHLASRSTTDVGEQLLRATADQVEARIKRRERLYRLRIDANHDGEVIGNLLTLAHDAKQFSRYYEDHLPLIERRHPPSSYEHYGQLLAPRNNQQSLASYAKAKVKLWPQECPKNVTNRDQECLRRASKDPYLAVRSVGKRTHQAEVECLNDLSIEEETDVERDKEIEQELATYHSIQCGTPKEEDRKWNLTQLVDALRSSSSTPFTKTLSQFLSEGGRSYRHLQANYAPVFDDRLVATHDFLVPYDQPLPIFHPAFRPAQQILVVDLENAGIRGVALTASEARYVKSELLKKPISGIYLIQANGSPLSPFPKSGPPRNEALIPLLIRANALNGNVSYLDSHDLEAMEWLLSGNSQAATRFLKLKIHQDPKQRAIFKNSPLFQGASEGTTSVGGAQRINSSQTSQLSGAITDPTTVAPNLIHILSREQVPQLEKLMQIQKLTKKQLGWITPKQVPALLPSQIKHLTDPSLIQALPADKLRHVSDLGLQHLSPAQIRGIQDAALMTRLTRSQWPHITWNQSKPIWLKARRTQIAFVGLVLLMSYLSRRYWVSRIAPLHPPKIPIWVPQSPKVNV